MVAVGIAVLRAIYQSVKNAGKAFSEDEKDEVLFLHQGNDERENLPWRREKKEGYLSPNMRIRRQYKKTIKKAGKYQPTGAETPAELEEKNELSGDGMRRLHDGYEKPLQTRGLHKEEAEELRLIKPVRQRSQTIEKAEQPACKDTVQNDRSGDGENFRTDAEDLSFFFIFNRRSCNRVGKAGDRDERTAAGKGDDFLIDVEAG